MFILQEVYSSWAKSVWSPLGNKDDELVAHTYVTGKLDDLHGRFIYCIYMHHAKMNQGIECGVIPGLLFWAIWSPTDVGQHVGISNIDMTSTLAFDKCIVASLQHAG